MTTEAIAPAILQYVETNAYPEGEDVISADLTPDVLATLLKELRRAQGDVQSEIRGLSKTAAPDIDSWISRAKELQADIQRSRETARQIVEEHEAGKELHAKVEDARKKVELLEKEVAFEETLGGTLEHIMHVNGLLDRVQDEAVKEDVRAALEHLEQAKSRIGALDGLRDSKACGLLQGRATQLKQDLSETTCKLWNARIKINQDAQAVVIGQVGVGEMDLEALVASAQDLDIFDSLIQRLSKDLERTIFRPRLHMDSRGEVAKATVSSVELSTAQRQDDASCDSLFADVHAALEFFTERLPATVIAPLSESLMPALMQQLEESWLEPAVPLDIAEMPSFQDVLAGVQKLATDIDRLGWRGSGRLHDWVRNAPRTWLTKRRENLLGDVRNLVFTGLRETRVVERVETQMMSKTDHQALQGGGGNDDDWDTAWDEPQEDANPAEPAGQDDDDVSAWDTGDADENRADEPVAGGDDSDAWGWGDEEQPAPSPAPLKPATAQGTTVNGGQPSGSDGREVTLRETFTVTSVPEGVLEIVQKLIADAQTLAGPDYASSPIAPVATALYSVPTLALAIYRATAPTAYNKLPTGNMLIYNDATHLASKLRDWQAAEPPASRLRLDNDVKALEAFAKRAYSAEMDSQRTILRDLLDSAGGFSNVTEPPFKQECENAAEQTVDRLREVHRQWQPILSSGALLQSLGSLLASVTGKLISDIEDLGDIGAEDSHQLRQLMDRISEAKELFYQQWSDGEGEGTDTTFIYCPNWLKFQYLAEILESSLADIKYLWNEGELSLEFEAEEVVELIEGLFADSDNRRRTIQDIRRSRR